MCFRYIVWVYNSQWRRSHFSFPKRKRQAWTSWFKIRVPFLDTKTSGYIIFYGGYGGATILQHSQWRWWVFNAMSCGQECQSFGYSCFFLSFRLWSYSPTVHLWSGILRLLLHIRHPCPNPRRIYLFVVLFMNIPFCVFACSVHFALHLRPTWPKKFEPNWQKFQSRTYPAWYFFVVRKLKPFEHNPLRIGIFGCKKIYREKFQVHKAATTDLIPRDHPGGLCI